MASGNDLSLDDLALSAELLPGFLDELNDADLLLTSSRNTSSQTPPLASYRDSFNVSPTGFVTCSGTLTPNTALSGAATGSADAVLHLTSSVSGDDAGMRSRSLNTSLKKEKSGAHRPPMQNSTRIRQKEELKYLRNKVQMLEQELESKRRALMDTKGGERGNRTFKVQVRRRALRWHRIAKRQLVEKQRAEMQNLQLRESLTDQIKLARSLQRLLKRNASRKDETTETAQLQARLEFSNCVSGESEDSLYETLLRDMDAVYAEVDTICARHPVMQSLEEGSDVSSLQVGETEALYLEATNSKVVPFGMEETCSAVWHCLSRDHVKLADGTYHGVASSPDSIRAKAIMTLRVDSAQALMQMRFAMKKYVERDRVVLTLESASESEGPRDLLHGLKMMQRAWVVIRRVPIEPDDAESDGTPEETIIQLCIRLTPSLSAGVLNSPGQRTGAVTELLLAAVYRNLSWLFQAVENILMGHQFSSAPL
ncbi:hypothetical protein KRP22_014530 [Phytophthora ramorum]|nr:hypothetical protein KRP22_8867 [Phytophthora ramorum]